MNDTVFVDKSDLIRITNAVLNSKEKFICVTRPRRFGKSMAIGMLANDYSKGSSFKEMFDRLRISKDPSYLIHLNQHNVIADLDASFPGVMSKEDDTISKAIRKIHHFIDECPIF